MRLTLVISSLQSGGAERVMTIMANYWANKGHEITLLTLDDKSKLPFYSLDSKVRHIALAVDGKSTNAVIAILNNLKRILVLRQAIRQSRPDAVISFMEKTNVNVLLALRGVRVPVVISERIDPASYPISRIWDALRHWTYPMADRLVIQSARVLNYFSPEVQTRTTMIPNPVLPPSIDKAEQELTLPKPSIIAMGRLERQKGFDLLLQAFARLHDRHSEWNLTILGDGPLRKELESLRDKLGLTGYVTLAGRVKRPHAILKQADLFVMSSRFEGFPNALCEAMACGLPVISTNCPTGPIEIVRNGVDGILVTNESIDALTIAMGRMMSDEDERNRLALRASEVIERFGLEQVMQMWESVLYNVLYQPTKPYHQVYRILSWRNRFRKTGSNSIQ